MANSNFDHDMNKEATMTIKSIQLAATWLFAAVFSTGCIIVVPGGCWKETVGGSGNVVTEQREVDEFSSLNLKGPGKVILSQGEYCSVEIRTDDNILPLIQTTVSGKELAIEHDNYNLKPTTLEFFVTVRQLNGVSVAGSGDVVGKSRFVVESFSAGISGSGDMSLEVEAARVESSVTGSGSIVLAGSSEFHKAKITGSGEIDAGAMKSRKAQVFITGSGDCMVNCSQALDAEITGSGDVYYTGRPQVNSRIKGSGEVKGVAGQKFSLLR